MPAAPKHSRELDSNELCPCGSGKKYGKCCKRRGFQWVRSVDGGFSKAVPISDELFKVLDDLGDEFQETFRRKPRKTDSLFTAKYYYSERDMERETIRAMKVADINPALMYASRKTGFLVANPKLLSTKEQEEYEDAIEEFYSLSGSGTPVSELLEPDSPEEFLSECLRRQQIIGGYFIEKYFNNPVRSKRGADKNIEFVVGFAVVNFVRCLRAVLILLESDVSFDAFSLVRNLYENYLTVRYVYAFPERIDVFSAQLGTLLGTHRFAISKGGVPIESKVVEIASGREINIPTRWGLVSALGRDEQELYNEFYRTLSSFSHSELTNFHLFVTAEGFDYLSQDFKMDVLLGTHLLTMLLFASLQKNSPCQKYLKRDLSTGEAKALFSLRLVELFLLRSGLGKFPLIFKTFMRTVAAGHPELQAIYDSFDTFEPQDTSS